MTVHTGCTIAAKSDFFGVPVVRCVDRIRHRFISDRVTDASTSTNKRAGLVLLRAVKHSAGPASSGACI